MKNKLRRHGTPVAETLADCRVTRFKNKLSRLLRDQDNTGYELMFYLTQKCNLACPGCYMARVPSHGAGMLPVADAEHYMRTFQDLPQFNHSVVFSGGEIFTLPVQYLEQNIRNALQINERLQLKTNGTWAMNPKRANEIFDMLARLDVPRGMIASKEQVHEFLSQFSREYAIAHRQEILARVCTELPTLPVLDLCMSVDNMIHPAQTADWFCEIVRCVGADEKLFKNLTIKSFTFTDCVDFFAECMSQQFSEDVITNFEKHPGNVFTYNVMGAHVESYFGDFINTSEKLAPETLGHIALPTNSGENRLAFYFFPDRTVAFCTYHFQTVGRVPYVTRDGRYKSVSELKRDMFRAVVNEYCRAITR